jgi:hypothetical protein
LAIKAICVACGKPKRDPYVECKACGFQPQTDYQMARALIFSPPSSAIHEKIGRDQKSLKALSKQITGGRPYEFDPVEVEATVKVYLQLKQAILEKKKRTRKIVVLVLLLAILAAGVAGYLFIIQ